MKVRFIPLTLVLLLVYMASRPMTAQAQKAPTFVDKVDVTSEVVTFQPRKGNYVDFTMRIAGPDDFWMEQHFSGEETPSLRVRTKEGYLANGSYQIEMVARPILSEKQMKALDEVRHKGDRHAIKKTMKEIGFDPAEMTFSTSLGVAEGKFLNPEVEEEGQEGERRGEDGDTEDLGAVESAPSIKSVELTGRRWDAAYLPHDATGSLATADATGAALHNAMLTTTNNPAAAADAAESWYEVSFVNEAADGTPITYEGYLRPAAYDGEGKLFQAYLRQAEGAVYGAWVNGYFLYEDGAYRFLNNPQETNPMTEGLFDYVADEKAMAELGSMDIVHLDDVIISFSLCVGNDCVNGESFGFDTIRLKENNVRIHFDDTSTTASFPQNDWRIIVNDSSNGGDNHMAFEDSSAGRQIFRVDAGAPANSLRVDSAGDVGIGTSNPVVDLHVVSGNTPTVRLEQNGSSGFTAQTWDLSGNEANFFVRDATNGSKLPFRIEPNTPQDALFLQNDGNIGIGTNAPSSDLHIRRTTTNPVTFGNMLHLEGAGFVLPLFESTDNNSVQVLLKSDDTNRRIVAIGSDDANESQIVLGDNGTFEFLGPTGTDVRAMLTSAGLVTQGPTCNPGPCDATFQPDKFEVPSIEEHAAFMWENSYLWGVGPTPADSLINLTQKTGGILHELEVAHIYIEQLHKRLQAMEARLEAMEKTQD